MLWSSLLASHDVRHTPDSISIVHGLALGGRFGERAHAHSFSMLDAFKEVGGTIIDTAHAYADGESERVIGSWLSARGCRDNMLIIDKVCHPSPDGTPRLQPAIIHAELDESLRRLRTDRIDLLLLHRDNRRVPVEPIISALSDEVVRGRTRAVGVSNWTLQRLEEALSCRSQPEAPPSASSCQLSLAIPERMPWPGSLSLDAASLKWHERTQMPLLAWSAQARGWFSGQHSDPGVLNMFDSPRNWQALRECQELAAVHGTTPTAIALAWLLARPFPVTAIIGPETVDELEDAISAFRVQLSSQELASLTLNRCRGTTGSS